MFYFQSSTGGSSTLHRFPVSNQDRGFSLQLEPWRNQLPGYQQQNFGQFQGFQRSVSFF